MSFRKILRENEGRVWYFDLDGEHELYGDFVNREIDVRVHYEIDRDGVWAYKVEIRATDSTSAADWCPITRVLSEAQLESLHETACQVVAEGWEDAAATVDLDTWQANVRAFE